MKCVILGNQAKSVGNFWSVLIRHMRQAGYETVCCVPPGDTESEKRLTSLGVRICRYSLERKGLNPIKDIKTFLELQRIFAQEKPEYVFASTIKPVIYGCLAARRTGVAHTYATITGLGYAFEADSLPKKAVYWISCTLYKLALSRVEGIFFQNRDDIDVFKSSGILAPDARILTARGTGVDTERFARAPLPDYTGNRLTGPPVFLMIARLLEAKGLREFAEAAATVKKKHPAAKFQVLGAQEQGPGAVPMEQILAWQHEGILEYLGETSDVRPYIAASHALVLPSWREGTPTSIMEGMSMGRAAVVSDAPGCREVVEDGVNGVLVPAKDGRALAGALEGLINSPERLGKMGRAGREKAEREFDADIVAEKILADMGMTTAKPRR